MFAYVTADGGQLVKVSNEINVEWQGRTIPNVRLLTPAERRALGIYDFDQAAGAIPPYHRAGATTYTIDTEAGVVTEVVEMIPYSVEEMQRALLDQVNALSATMLAGLKIGYPDGEISTWDQQVREATAHLTDAQSEVPMLAAMSLERGITLPDLAGRIMAKAGAFAALAGQIVGRRQRLEDDIAAIATDAEAATVAEQITTGWPV